jgi:apolipoprotein N-acyltransferase
LGIFLFVAGLLTIFISGNIELKKTYPTPLHWAIIQHNLPVSGKWRLEHPIYVRAKYRELALKAAKDKPGMIIFPLYSFPDDVLRSPEFFTGLAQETKTWILVATYIPQKEGQNITKGFFDAAILYSPEGKFVDHYQAVQPPPFRQIAEYNQKEYKILATPFGKLGILLCYEDSVPAIAKEAVKKGADILVALSNPGHFSNTWMPHYHLMQDRLRAIEAGHFVVRASANGYSGVVDPKGRFLQRSALNKEEILQINVGIAEK